jgi:tol-pal system protein YbgF
MKKHLVAAGVVSLLAALASPAQAGLFDDEEARKAIVSLRAQIDEQQRRNSELNDQVNTLRRSLLDLNSQLDGLRAELAQVRGQGEMGGQSVQNVNRTLADLQRQQKDQLTALDERLRTLEPQRVNLDGREVTVRPEEKQAYDAAVNTLRNSDFAGAIAAFQSFRSRFPGSAYSGHVLYWLGNAQYGKGDLKAAMTSFRTLVDTAPDHPRAPEAMLSIANCQAELKDTKGARATLTALLKQYPDSEAAKAGRERLALLK